MIFQYLLFTSSSNIFYTAVHMQHHEYIMIKYFQHNISYKAQWTMFLAIKKLKSGYSGALCIKIHLFNITTCFVYYIV